MPADPAYRLAIQQRLASSGLPTSSVAADEHCLQWQQLLLYCGCLPLAVTPAANIALELNSPWLPAQPSGSFALLVAGHHQALQQAVPLLNALAPQAGCWLYCGPLGAASFCRRVLDALFYLTGPLLLQTANISRQAPDWPSLLLQQKELLQQLAALSRDYLQRQGEAPATAAEQWQVLDDFRQPAPQQQHFARNLARLLLLLDSLGEQASQLLETTLAMPTAAPAAQNTKSPP